VAAKTSRGKKAKITQYKNAYMEDNSGEVIAQIDDNIKRALTAMGVEGVGLILDTMKHGYDRPIYQTGTLMRDIKYRINEYEQSVSWGVLTGDLSAGYAIPVHEGTAKRAGRPFIKDGILNNQDALRELGQEELKKGFEE